MWSEHGPGAELYWLCCWSARVDLRKSAKARKMERQLSRKPPTFCDASLLRLVKPHTLRGLPHALLQKRMQEAAFDYAPRHPESTVRTTIDQRVTDFFNAYWQFAEETFPEFPGAWDFQKEKRRGR